MEEKTKVCSKCGISKPADTENYHRNKNGKQNLNASCKKCVSEEGKRKRAQDPEKHRKRFREYYAKNKEKMRERNRKYQEENREITRKASKRWAENNKERVKENRRLYQKNNKEKIRKKQQKWKEKNPDYFEKYNKKWRIENAEHIKKYRDEWYSKNSEKAKRKSKEHSKKNRKKINERNASRRKTDQKFRITENLRSSIRRSLRKGEGSTRHLDFTVDELILHLESQFVEGMTWENFTEWHIDHIVPISSFDYESPEDENFKKCWSLENLQPLWASDNIRKKDSLDWLKDQNERNQKDTEK